MSGAITDTLSQQPTTTGKCRASGADTTGAALFGGDTGNYIVQIVLPAGSTTFPTTGPESIVFTSGADNAKVWVISKDQAAAAGTASLTGTHAVIDVDLLPAGSNSTGGSLHLTGALDC